MHEKQCHIQPYMTVLDIVSRYRDTESVFRKYDEKAGECICCYALFAPLHEVAEMYDLDLEKLISDLESSIKSC